MKNYIIDIKLTFSEKFKNFIKILKNNQSLNKKFNNLLYRFNLLIQKFIKIY